MVFTKVEDALSNCEVSAFGGRHPAEEGKKKNTIIKKGPIKFHYG
jgi:hypothetical protein